VKLKEPASFFFFVTSMIQKTSKTINVKREPIAPITVKSFATLSSFFSNGQHIASGAFGAVMKVKYNDKTLAVKILEKARNQYDNPHLIEVYTEVSILERCKGDRRVTQLFDYGCTLDSYYIVWNTILLH